MLFLATAEAEIAGGVPLLFIHRRRTNHRHKGGVLLKHERGRDVQELLHVSKKRK